MEEVLLEDLKLRKVPLVFADVGLAGPHVSNIRMIICMVFGRQYSI